MHNLEWYPNGVYWKYSGDVTGEEILEASKEIYGDPRFDSLDYKLVDFLDVDSMQISEHEIAEIACQHKAAAMSRENIKNAIVIKDEHRQLAVAFALFFEDSSWEVRIFQDLAEANEWLGRA